MHGLTVRFTVAIATFGVLLAPSGAQAAGCEVMHDPRERAECAARAQAREAARAEVRRELGAATPGQRGAAAPARTPAWQAAVEEAQRVDASEVLEPRPVAAIVGLVWFAVAVRLRLRRRRRNASA